MFPSPDRLSLTRFLIALWGVSTLPCNSPCLVAQEAISNSNAVAGIESVELLRESARKMQSIQIAMHKYYKLHRCFPAIASFDSADRPLLSWRVHLLPFLDEQDLYAQFHLDEPWDSEHNKQLIARMPDIYNPPGRMRSMLGTTTYLVPVGDKAMFTGKHAGTKMREFLDGTSSTAMIFDANEQESVVWTKPSGIRFNERSVKGSITRRFHDRILLGTANGAVYAIPSNTNYEKLIGIVTRAGGELIDPALDVQWQLRNLQ